MKRFIAKFSAVCSGEKNENRSALAKDMDKVWCRSSGGSHCMNSLWISANKRSAKIASSVERQRINPD